MDVPRFSRSTAADMQGPECRPQEERLRNKARERHSPCRGAADCAEAPSPRQQGVLWEKCVSMGKGRDLGFPGMQPQFPPLSGEPCNPHHTYVITTCTPTMSCSPGKGLK